MTSSKAPERVTYSPADFGAAMVAYVETHAKRPRRVRDGITSEAFHREGDNPEALRVWTERGAWADARAGESGGARDFARIVAGTDLVTFMRQWGPTSSTPRAPAAPIPAPMSPPIEEVDALWAACTCVADDAEVARYLEVERGLSVGRVADVDAARVLPRDGLPSWARAWVNTHRLVMPLVDSQGVTRSMLARRTAGDALKTLVPKGYATKGLVIVDRLTRMVLADAQLSDGLRVRDLLVEMTRKGTRPAVVIVEGELNAIAWMIDASDADADAPAIIGIRSGSWTREHAAAIPDGARVLVDTDHDASGDAYAQAIADTLDGRAVELLRIVRTAA